MRLVIAVVSTCCVVTALLHSNNWFPIISLALSCLCNVSVATRQNVYVSIVKVCVNIVVVASRHAHYKKYCNTRVYCEQVWSVENSSLF